jgi:hypothetical protein
VPAMLSVSLIILLVRPDHDPAPAPSTVS